MEVMSLVVKTTVEMGGGGDVSGGEDDGGDVSGGGGVGFCCGEGVGFSWKKEED